METCDTPTDAIIDVDIAVTTVTHTSVVEPFLDPAALSPGALGISADLSAPWSQDGFAKLDAVFVEDRAQEAALATKLVPPDVLTGDLADLVTGRYPGRRDEDARLFFTFRGHALGDLCLAILAYQASSLSR